MDRLVGIIAVDTKNGHSILRGQRRLLAKDREFFDDKADIAVGFKKLVHLVIGAAAIGAPIVHELDEGNVAVGIAANPRIFVFEKRLGVDANHCLVIRGGKFRLPLFKNGNCLHQHLGVVEKIGPNFGPKSLALGICHRAKIEGGGRAGKKQSEGDRGKALEHGLSKVVSVHCAHPASDAKALGLRQKGLTWPPLGRQTRGQD